MKFSEATEKVKTLSVRPNDETLLKLYGLYKQATKGNCDTTKPWFWDVVACAKWDAWSNNQGQSKVDAEKAYVKLVERLLKEDIERLLRETAGQKVEK
jgi:diazepam-binding inhibitor (GABA receptor modulating acyl-CoA-binding protein)